MLCSSKERLTPPWWENCHMVNKIYINLWSVVAQNPFVYQPKSKLFYWELSSHCAFDTVLDALNASNNVVFNLLPISTHGCTLLLLKQFLCRKKTNNFEMIFKYEELMLFSALWWSFWSLVVTLSQNNIWYILILQSNVA